MLIYISIVPYLCQVEMDRAQGPMGSNPCGANNVDLKKKCLFTYVLEF